MSDWWRQSRWCNGCRHCERSEASQARVVAVVCGANGRGLVILDCFVACAPRNDGRRQSGVAMNIILDWLWPMFVDARSAR